MAYEGEINNEHFRDEVHSILGELSQAVDSINSDKRKNIRSQYGYTGTTSSMKFDSVPNSNIVFLKEIYDRLVDNVKLYKRYATSDIMPDIITRVDGLPWPTEHFRKSLITKIRSIPRARGGKTMRKTRHKNKKQNKKSRRV